MWFDRPSWLNPSALGQMEITSPSVHSYAPIPPYCSAFQLTSEQFYRKRRLFSPETSFPAPPSPRRTASICPTPGLREEQEACAHSCMKPVCCSPLLLFHAHYLTMEPVTLDNKAATWGNNAGFSGFRSPLRRLVWVHSPPPISDTVTGWREKRDTVKPNFLQIKSN